MKKSMVNQTHIEGILYEHNLEKKVTGKDSKNPGTEYIAGSIKVATNDELNNICEVFYTYVTPTTSTGKTNKAWPILNSIIDGKIGTILKNGKENAGMVSIDSALALNEWYDNEDKLVSVPRNEGGFINVVSELNPDEKTRNTFKTDILITGLKRIEEDEERQIAEHIDIRGIIFNFKKEILPITYSVYNENAINYFESLEPSSQNPIFTKVWGRQESTTVKIQKVEESAFGEPSVTTIDRNRKSFTVTGAIQEHYEWDLEETLLASEVQEAQAQRELKLAEIKTRRDEYRNKQNQASTTPTVAMGGFDF